jgi:ribonuclease R
MLPDPEMVIAYMSETAYRPAKLKDLARGLGVRGDDYRALRQLMHELEAEEKVIRVHKGRYAMPTALSRAWGRLRIHERGFGFVARSGADADVFVPAGSLLDAIEGEWVEVEITEPGDGYERLPKGRVTAIRRQPVGERVGIFRRRGRHGLVATDDTLISLESPAPAETKDGDLVVVEVDGLSPPTAKGRRDAPHRGRAQAGRIVRVLGDPEDPRHDFDTVSLAHGIALDDDPTAKAEAEAMVQSAEEDRQSELTRRQDLRDLTVVTIDPDEARDFDDAVSVETLVSGDLRLGVHIADVAHYVPRGGAIDEQARDRSTSAYLLDRVVHMLPTPLAAKLCTLAPHEDRLAVSVFLDVDGGGVVYHRSFCLSVIRSSDRLTYTQVQAALDDDYRGAGPASAHMPLLSTMADLSQRMKARRLERGAIDFDLPEAEVKMGDKDIPSSLGRATHMASHSLIEEFMLAANEAVAEESVSAELPVLFRVHAAPDAAKLEPFRSLAGSLGYRLAGAGAITSGHLQKALEALQDRPDTALLSQLLLRAMMRACYATDAADGHFGLASERYLHFTSPIRRYPDLVVHRALRAHIGQTDEVCRDEGLDWLAEWTSHCERRAEAAERDYIRLKQLRFMTAHVGEEHAGVISGIVGSGCFVALADWLVEGFCPIRLLDDYFEFDESRHQLRGQQTGQVFAMGTPVRVRVLTVEPLRRRMDVLVIEGGTQARSSQSVASRGDRRASSKDNRQAKRKARPQGKGGRGRRANKRRR